METTVKIKGMSCNHCVQTVRNAILQLAGVDAVSVSLEKAQAVITHNKTLDLAQVSSALQDAGYEVEA